MIFIYPVGIPLGYACLLFRLRGQINPLGCDDQLQAMRARTEAKSTNPELRAIDFLFSCYRPGAWWFEVFDSVRRIVMTGLITYVPKTSGPPVAGIALSLLSLTVFREVQPNARTNQTACSQTACSATGPAVREPVDERVVDIWAVAAPLDLPLGLRACRCRATHIISGGYE